MAKPERELVSVLRGFRENLPSLLGVGVASGVPRPKAGMDLRRVEAVEIRRASNELSELIRQIEQGAHYSCFGSTSPSRPSSHMPTISPSPSWPGKTLCPMLCFRARETTPTSCRRRRT